MYSSHQASYLVTASNCLGTLNCSLGSLVWLTLVSLQGWVMLGRGEGEDIGTTMIMAD